MAPYLAAVVGGVLFWAAFPPLGWGLLAFVVPAPLLWATRRVDRPGEAMLVGFVFGAVAFGAMLWWIRILGFVAWVPLTFALAAYAAGYAFLAWAFRLWPAGRWWLIVVAGWGLWELLRSVFPFGGFPWGTLGYAAAGTPGFIGSVQWIGPGGWSVLAVAFSAGLVLILEHQRHWRYLVDPAVVVLLLALAGSLFAPRADGGLMRVAIIQGNSPCPMVHCQNENQRIFESHLELTRSLLPGSVDLVVWPENSTGTPFEPDGNPEVRDAIAAEAERLGTAVLISGTRADGPGNFRNVNMMFSPFGTLIGEYDKRHPVPFGEYVPLRGLLGFIPQLDRVPRDMTRGDEPVVFRLRQGPVGSVISFEGAFSRLVRSVAREGAELMVVATNESTFGDSPASDQLIGLTRVNAAAIGQDLVHAAITGKSTLIEADGDVGETTSLYEPAILRGEVAFRDAGPTIYTRLGDWVVYLALLAGIAAIAVPGEGRAEALHGGRPDDRQRARAGRT